VRAGDTPFGDPAEPWPTPGTAGSCRRYRGSAVTPVIDKVATDS